MGQELYWTYAFNIFLNSFLSFFTTLFFIEFLIRLLRIKHPRFKAFCYCIPFCKIGLDLFLYRFSNWALLHQVNPISAEKGTRQLSLHFDPFTGIWFSMQDGKTFSLADVIALSVDPLWIRGIVSIALAGILVACLSRGIRIFQDKCRIDLLLQKKEVVPRSSLNPLLAAEMKRKKVQCAVTSAIHSPCLIRNIILFPADLISFLSQEEFEAILAHEMAHLQWKDRSIKLACVGIAALFWWIPTRRWQKRIEESQELAADAAIHRFGISRFALAEAILKTARKEKAKPFLLSFSFIGHHLSLKRRVELILRKPNQQTLGRQWMQYGLLGIGLLSILFGRLWIF